MMLVDTNVISELRKFRPDPWVADWMGAIDISTLRLSVLSIGEMRWGIEKVRRRDPAQAEALEPWLADVIEGWSGQMVDVDATVAEAWGRLKAVRPLPLVDGLLAATALVHGWTLVTRNTKDLAGTGVDLYDPWSFGLEPEIRE